MGELKSAWENIPKLELTLNRYNYPSGWISVGLLTTLTNQEVRDQYNIIYKMLESLEGTRDLHIKHQNQWGCVSHNNMLGNKLVVVRARITWLEEELMIPMIESLNCFSGHDL